MHPMLRRLAFFAVWSLPMLGWALIIGLTLNRIESLVAPHTMPVGGETLTEGVVIAVILIPYVVVVLVATRLLERVWPEPKP